VSACLSPGNSSYGAPQCVQQYFSAARRSIIRRGVLLPLSSSFTAHGRALGFGKHHPRDAPVRRGLMQAAPGAVAGITAKPE
jgi:hypothetical protein